MVVNNLVRQYTHKWHFLDGEGQRVGKLAMYCATLLIGKHKPTFSPNRDCGDNIVVINARKLILTGNKIDYLFGK